MFARKFHRMIPKPTCAKLKITNFFSTATTTYQVPYTPRRSLMYVPGNDDRKVSKIPKLGADCICLDCEDGVALNMKETARDNIRNILDTKRVEFGNSECSVRVNSVDSGLCERDLEVVLGGEHRPSAVHLPKVRGREELEFVWSVVEKVVGKVEQQMGLIMFIETARSLIDIDHICQAAWDLAKSPSSPLCPVALVFGSDDFAADIGATRTTDNMELLLARQVVVTAAKAHRLQAIDCVYIDYKDQEGLKRQSEEGARWGFTGKQVIHPGQVDIVQAAFTPAKERVEWATELLRTFKEQQLEGRGAFTFRGHMIDMPTVKQAQNVLDIAGKSS